MIAVTPPGGNPHQRARGRSLPHGWPGNGLSYADSRPASHSTPHPPSCHYRLPIPMFYDDYYACLYGCHRATLRHLVPVPPTPSGIQKI